jgi:guanylate kinase
MTTRRPRPGEVDGESYHFVTDEVFQSVVDEGGFLEYAEVFGNRYGTPKGPVMGLLDEGRDILLEIDVQGALQVKRNFPESILVFILPPSLDDLRERIVRRGAESAEQVDKRTREAEREIAELCSYDYVVVNDDVGRAVAGLNDIMEGRRDRVCEEEARGIIERFRADAVLMKARS